jgi:hypothetical protein
MLVDAQIASPVEIAKLPGTSVAQPMMIMTGGERVVPYATAGGVALENFDGAWQDTGTVQLADTDPARELTATEYGDVALVAWTTPNRCYVSNVNGFAPGFLSSIAEPCNRPRIAGDAFADTAVLVYEAPDGIRMVDAMRMQIGTSPVLLRSQGHSPRTIYDGTRFWVSYIDQRGYIAVGFFDANGLVTIELAGIRPRPQAYELVLVEGSPWVMAYDADNGFTAHQMCVDTE